VQPDEVAFTDTERSQMVRETVRAFVQLRIRQTASARDDRFAIGSRIRDELEQIGEVEGAHGTFVAGDLRWLLGDGPFKMVRSWRSRSGPSKNKPTGGTSILVRFEIDGTDVRRHDMYIDLVVGPPQHPYSVLDLEEFGEALRNGTISVADAADVLNDCQRFIDRRLNRHKDPLSDGWPDFPPRELEPVLVAPIPPLASI
jgi:hypothetical protein